MAQHMALEMEMEMVTVQAQGQAQAQAQGQAQAQAQGCMLALVMDHRQANPSLNTSELSAGWFQVDWSLISKGTGEGDGAGAGLGGSSLPPPPPEGGSSQTTACRTESTGIKGLQRLKRFIAFPFCTICVGALTHSAYVCSQLRTLLAGTV
jgi:hypothetical protein